MPSRVVTKVISAAAVALVVELTDLALEKSALSADRFRLARKIIKSGVGAAAGALLAKALQQAGGAGPDAAGADAAGPDATDADATGPDAAGAVHPEPRAARDDRPRSPVTLTPEGRAD